MSYCTSGDRRCPARRLARCGARQNCRYWRRAVTSSSAAAPLQRPARTAVRGSAIPVRAPALRRHPIRNGCARVAAGHRLRPGKYLARELGYAIVAGEPAEVSTLPPEGQLDKVAAAARNDPPPLRDGSVRRAARLRRACAAPHIDARRHREQHVAHANAVPGAVISGVSAKCRRHAWWEGSGTVALRKQRFDGGRRGLADDAVRRRRRVVGREQALTLRRRRSSSVQARWRSVSASSASPGQCNATPLIRAAATFVPASSLRSLRRGPAACCSPAGQVQSCAHRRLIGTEKSRRSREAAPRMHQAAEGEQQEDGHPQHADGTGTATADRRAPGVTARSVRIRCAQSARISITRAVRVRPVTKAA